MASNPVENFRTFAGKSPEEAKFFWTAGRGARGGGGENMVSIIYEWLHGV